MNNLIEWTVIGVKFHGVWWITVSIKPDSEEIQNLPQCSITKVLANKTQSCTCWLTPLGFLNQEFNKFHNLFNVSHVNSWVAINEMSAVFHWIRTMISFQTNLGFLSETFYGGLFLSLVLKISLWTSVIIIQLLSINQFITQINNWSLFPYFLMKLGSFLEESSEKSDLFLTRCSMNHMSTVMRSNGKLSMMSSSTSEIRSKFNL